MAVGLCNSLGLLFIALVLYRAGVVIYRLYFHPLARFPGPRFHAASWFPSLWQNQVQGSFGATIAPLHEKYGDIVRIAPNRLLVSADIGWPDIFARRSPGQPEFVKRGNVLRPATDIPPGIFLAPTEDHRRQRRLLSHAFSDGALQSQESYLQHYVDLFISRLREQVGKLGQEDAGVAVVDMTKWFNFLTFDIIGELLFADPFDSLRNSDYHPWVALIFQSLRAGSLGLFFKAYPLVLFPVARLAMWRGNGKRDSLARIIRDKTEKRIELGLADPARRDFMAYLLRHNGEEDKGMTHDEIIDNSRLLSIAGSETTATALSGLVFLLGTSPQAYARLTDEIRSSFTHEREIDLKSTARLPYLHACLDETLRIYPPAPSATPRVSPGAVVGTTFIPKGTFVTVSSLGANRSAQHFTDPMLFAPERYLAPSHPLWDERYKSDNLSVARPFSVGPRDCIGKNLANAEMRLTAARLLWNFDTAVVEGQDSWMSGQRIFGLWEKPPLMVRLRPRPVAQEETEKDAEQAAKEEEKLIETA